MVPTPVFSSLLPFIVHNHTVVFPWISACYFGLVSSSALPASSFTFTLYKYRFQFGKKGLHGFDSDTFKKILEVNKWSSLSTENSTGKGVDRKSLGSQRDHTQFAHQLHYDFPTRVLTALQNIYYRLERLIPLLQQLYIIYIHFCKDLYFLF